MEQQKTHQKTSPPSTEDMPPQPEGGGLLRQAKGYGDAARRARENCSRDEAAEKELMRRRNKSGQ